MAKPQRLHIRAIGIAGGAGGGVLEPERHSRPLGPILGRLRRIRPGSAIQIAILAEVDALLGEFFARRLSGESGQPASAKLFRLASRILVCVYTLVHPAT